MAAKSPRNCISDGITDAVEARIVSGTLHPGAHLDEGSLAKEFGVSRTPIREALGKLQARGIIEIRPRRGAIVTETSAETVCEMFEVMADLEAMCARLAARRRNDFDLKALFEARLACENAEQRGDLDAYFCENERFHQTLYAASHNKTLQDYTQAISRRLGFYRKRQLQLTGRLKKSIEGHAGVADAIRQGDAGLAAEIIHDHILLSGDLFSDWLSSLLNRPGNGRQPAFAAPDATPDQGPYGKQYP